MISKITIAALLHDIGKFWQRADDNSMRNSDMLDKSVKELEAQYCLLHRDGYYTHKHVLWTAQFMEKYQNLFKGVFDKTGRVEDLIIRLAAMHHRPNSESQKLIQLADWLSSGVDRSSDRDSQKETEQEVAWKKFKKTKLRSIFESLGYDNNIEHKYLLPLKKQELNEEMMPQSEVSEGEYHALWEQFTRELEFIQTGDPIVIIETLTALLHKYTSNIPSSTIHLPDVSLFDHLKSTAALAHCLVVYQQETGATVEDLRSNPEFLPFLFVGGDLSGIQKYIYDIVSKGAAKNLKGRSFYLQLLIESILDKIKTELELYDLNVEYASGGGFYLLAPNTQQNSEKVKSLESVIQKTRYEQYEGELYLALDSVMISCQDLFEHRISEKWSELGELISEKKRRKFKDYIQSDYSRFFEPIQSGGDVDVDAITGQPLSRYVRKINNRDADEELTIDESTYEQIRLGRELRSVDYWIKSHEKIKYWNHPAYNPGELGVYHYFVSVDSIQKYKEKLRGSVDRRTAKVINDTNFLESAIQGVDNIYGFEYYGGNDFPAEEDGSPVTFEQLAKTEVGMSQLGVLRMDVDNLGQIFINGMREEKRTFSRYSTLSRNLDWFFKGYINTIWKNNEKFRHNTQIIYSGGDDLFIVGQWIPLVCFAKKIREEFEKWTCNNPNMTLSGGIALIGGKFPILKGADEAASAEDLAKNYKRGDQTKNAFSIFGFSLSWDPELDKVIEWKDNIKKLLKEDKLPKSFISRVVRLHSFIGLNRADYERRAAEKIPYDRIPPKIYWMSAYDLQRLKSNIRDQEAKNFIENCKTAIYTNEFDDWDCGKNSNYHFLELLYLAARWADFEMRK